MGLLDAASPAPPTAWDLTGHVLANRPLSSGLWRLDLALPRTVPFEPGQFAMLNPRAHGRLVFRRPFSILAGDGASLSFMYRVVGRGTTMLAALAAGDPVDCLAPLGRGFPPPAADTPPVLILAGGVGLPPLHAWFVRHGRPADLVCFGGRDPGDVPWSLLPEPWQVSVDRAGTTPPPRPVHQGLVTELALARLADPGVSGTARAAAGDGPDPGRLVLACGPTPLLRAAAELAAAHRWSCLVSLEEHMGCGYGVCKGCVVPLRDPGPTGWRNVNSCTEGPVFAAADLDWERFGAHHAGETA